MAYDDDSAVSTPIDTTKSIKLSEQVTYNTTDVFTTTTQYIDLTIIPFNIKSTGTTYRKHFINSNTPNEFDDSGKLIYVDTVSQNILNQYYTQSNSSSGGYTTLIPARKIFIANNDNSYPSFTASGDIEDYDHSEIIVDNTDTYYNNELQFTNGRLRTFQDTNSFIDYTSNFLDVSGTKTMSDYSTASDSEFRYITLEYDLSTATNTTINYVDVIFNNFDFSNTTINSTGTIDSNDFEMYMKLIDNNNYTPAGDETDYTSVWLDCNAVLSTAIGRTKTNYSSGTTLAVLENSSSGNTETSPSSGSTQTKRIVLATGTSTNNLKIYLRVGFHMSVDISMGYITLKFEE